MSENKFSPYAKTKSTWYMDQYTPIVIRPASDDKFYVIPSKYHQQPWRVAKFLYGQERLYYVFTLLNMDLIKDPLYDFKAGLTIRVPSNERMMRIIGG